MKVRLTYEFDSQEEVLAHLNAQLLQPTATPGADQPAPRRTRKPAPARMIEDPIPPLEEPEEVVDAERTYSVDDAREALRKLHEARGMDVARTVLQKNGVERLRDIDPADYGAFIKSCETELTN